jgi:threonine dehydrogenase-like Zn-dependent dehydrogenase
MAGSAPRGARRAPIAAGDRVAVLETPGRVAVRARAPRRPGDHEARIRFLKAGICGTDLSLFSGDYGVDLPLVPGHEWVGAVDAVGPGADPDLVGRRVVGEINFTCLSYRRRAACAACARDLESHCLRRGVMGIVRADGAWATAGIVPAANLHRLPPSIPDRHAVLIEPLAAAIQTFELAPVYPGEHVVVLGAGRLGALVVQVAALRGARVLAVSRSAAKRRRALSIGARVAMAPGPRLAAAVRDATGGLGADVVVEATGTPAGFDVALDLVRPRGTIALKSTCGLPARLDATRAVVAEVQISCSRCGPFEKSIAMMRDGRLKLDLLFADELPLSRIAAALAAARGGAGKVLVDTAAG